MIPLKAGVLGGVKRFLLLLFASLVFAVVWFFVRLEGEISEYSSIEQRASKVVGPAELQAWAIEILNANVETKSVTLMNPKYKGVADLIGVYKRKPYAGLIPGNGHSGDHVSIIWNAGRLGVCGFDVGRSNFVSRRSEKVNRWADGVYFWVIPD
jgi:hypothetical protein